MKRVRKWVLAIAGAPLLAGCANQAEMITCADTGSYVFTQNGFEIGGTKSHVGTCIGPGASSDNTLWPTSLANGRLSSGTISFEIGLARCRYEGTVTSTSPEKL